MRGHEVKNGAPMTDDGRLLVRGNALQSSRTEPFERVLFSANIGLRIQRRNPRSRRSVHWTVKRDVYPAEVTGVASTR
jgi:hypothetical protein